MFQEVVEMIAMKTFLVCFRKLLKCSKFAASTNVNKVQLLKLMIHISFRIYLPEL